MDKEELHDLKEDVKIFAGSWTVFVFFVGFCVGVTVAICVVRFL